MLAFTPDAARAMRQVMAARGAEGLRIRARARRFSRSDVPMMHLELAYGPPVEEVVFEAEGARLYVDAETMKVLSDKLIHADVTGEEPRFELFRWLEGAPAEVAQPAHHAA